MLSFLQQPYVFALSMAVATAMLVYMYSKTTERDPAQCNKTFFKTLVAGGIAGAVLTYLSTTRPAPLATEPFDVLAPAVGATMVPGTGI